MNLRLEPGGNDTSGSTEREEPVSTKAESARVITQQSMTSYYNFFKADFDRSIHLYTSCCSNLHGVSSNCVHHTQISSSESSAVDRKLATLFYSIIYRAHVSST